MKITCEGFYLKIISEDEYRNYFHLIERNRERLLSSFPRTLSSVRDLEQAKGQLEKILSGYSIKEIYPFGVYREESLIGWISIKNIDWRVSKGELGYFIDEAFQGQGIVSEAVKEIVEYAFNELGMEKIFIRTGPDNIGSQKIALKNGFTKEGVLRKEFKVDGGELIDTVYYGKLKTD